MQLNRVNFLIAVAVSALIAYGLWSTGGDLRTFVAIGSFIYLSGTLAPAIGLRFEHARTAANLRVICFVFFLIGLVINLAFSLVGGSETTYIIVNAISFLTFILLANFVNSARQ